MTDQAGEGQGAESSRTTRFVPGPAADAVISLSQAILAPLDAIAKAQVHAARSFLNFVLQIGYPHVPVGPDGKRLTGPNDTMYCEPFKLDHASVDEEGNVTHQSVTLAIPTLALVPVRPLCIESAKFDIELVVKELTHHKQIQRSEAEALLKEQKQRPYSGKETPPESDRPWYLVSEPVSVRGTLTDPGGADSASEKMASIKVHVELKCAPTPAGLSKLLTAMTQVSGLTGKHQSKDNSQEEPAPPARPAA